MLRDQPRSLDTCLVKSNQVTRRTALMGSTPASVDKNVAAQASRVSKPFNKFQQGRRICLEEKTLQPLINPLGQKCYLCLRYILLPMSPGRTLKKLVAGEGFEPSTFGL